MDSQVYLRILKFSVNIFHFLMWVHQCERGDTARCVGGVHMFVNGSNHPYGCIQQCQSEGHWNNTPQTPNLTSYMARMGARSRFSGRINVNVVAQRGVLEVYICS